MAVDSVTWTVTRGMQWFGLCVSHQHYSVLWIKSWHGLSASFQHQKGNVCFSFIEAWAVGQVNDYYLWLEGDWVTMSDSEIASRWTVYCTESHGVFCHLSLSLSRMHPYLYTRAVPLCLRPAFFNGMTWNFKQKWLIESIPGSAFLLNLSDY